MPSPALRFANRPPWGIAGITKDANKCTRSDMVGTGGTNGLPTGWSIGTSALTLTVLGKGVDHGIPYVDIRWSGTAGAADTPNIKWSANGDIAGAQNDVWDYYVFLSLLDGSFANITAMQIVDDSFSAGPTYIGGDYSGTSLLTTVVPRPLNNALFVQRQTISTALTTLITPYLALNATNGAAVDFKLRVGYPMARKN